MDGDPVREGEPPHNAGDGSDGGDSAVTPISLAEMFEKLCPAYMAMGMSYDEFWHRNTKAHKAYREAWEQKKQYRNWEMWWQGMYVYDLLMKLAPILRTTFGKGRVEPGKYAEEPYPLTQKDAEAMKEAKRQENIKRMIAMFEQESAENMKKRLEAKED